MAWGGKVPGQHGGESELQQQTKRIRGWVRRTTSRVSPDHKANGTQDPNVVRPFREEKGARSSSSKARAEKPMMVDKWGTVKDVVFTQGGFGKVRELLMADSWAELHVMLGTLEQGPPLHELCAEEARRASVELQDNLAFLEARLKAALAAKRSKRPASVTSGTAAWDHSELSALELREAMAALRGFPLQGPSTASLLRISDLVVRIRESLLSTSWGELCGILNSVTDGELTQHDEVRSAGMEVDDMRQHVETELRNALESGHSLKIVGKAVKVFVDKSHFLPITWDHSSVKDGLARLQAAHTAVSSFPGVAEREGVGALLELAALVARLRKLLLSTDASSMLKTDPWEQLGAALEAITLPSHLLHDEVVMARQEYLTHELEKATKSLDQAALKRNLAMATGAGMLPVEKPVYQALGVFIDPPEYVINLPKPKIEGVPIEVGPDASGQLVLKVKIRGAKTIQWVKNGLALKEGADGGRIKGVETIELTLTKMFPRDENMTLQCIAKNKFGVVKSNAIKIRLGAAPVSANPPEEKEHEDDEDEDAVKSEVSLTSINIHGDL